MVLLLGWNKTEYLWCLITDGANIGVKSRMIDYGAFANAEVSNFDPPCGPFLNDKDVLITPLALLTANTEVHYLRF